MKKLLKNGKMELPLSEAYNLPTNAKSLIRSVMAILCGSHYPLHMAMVEASSQRVFFGSQVSTIGMNVAPLSQIVAEDTRSSAWRSKRRLERDLEGKALESGKREHKYCKSDE